MKKKISSIFMALAMIIMFVPVSYAANSGNCGGMSGNETNATWTYDGNGTLEISGTGTAFFRYQADEFGGEWVTKIIINEGITEIFDKSFDTCSRAKVVYIPQTMQNFGTAAFIGSSFDGIYYGGTENQWNQLSKPNEFNGVPVYFNSNPNNMTPAPTPTPGTVLAPEHDAGGLYDMDTSAGTTTFHVEVSSPSLIMWWKNFFDTQGGNPGVDYTKYTAEVYVYDVNGLLMYRGSATTDVSESMNPNIDVPMNVLLYEGNSVRFSAHFGEAYPV